MYLSKCPEILTISKTEVNDEKIKVNCSKIPNCEFMFSNSSTKAGDIALYILNSLKYTRREDVESKSRRLRKCIC